MIDYVTPSDCLIYPSKLFIPNKLPTKPTWFNQVWSAIDRPFYFIGPTLRTRICFLLRIYYSLIDTFCLYQTRSQKTSQQTSFYGWIPYPHCFVGIVFEYRAGG